MKYLLVVLMAFFFSSCAENQPLHSVLEDIKFKPQIAINDTKITSINLDSIAFQSRITLTNLFPLDIYIKDAMVNIYYQDKIINSYKIKGQNTLQARSKNEISLDSNIKINDLVKLISDYTSLDSIPLKLEVTTSIFLPNFDKENVMEYNLREKLDINIPTINPKITLKNIDFSLSNIKAIFNLKNTTSTNFNLSPISYTLNLNGIEFRGVAQTIPQNDNSIDIVLNDLGNSLHFTTSKEVSLHLDTQMTFEGLSYNIPLTLDKTF